MEKKEFLKRNDEIFIKEEKMKSRNNLAYDVSYFYYITIYGMQTITASISRLL